MPEVVPLPSCGEVFLDAHDERRLLRASWRQDEAADVIALSLWRDDDCVGEFRMGAEDVLEFVRVLVEGLVDKRSVETGPVRLGPATPLTLATP